MTWTLRRRLLAGALSLLVLLPACENGGGGGGGVLGGGATGGDGGDGGDGSGGSDPGNVDLSGEFSGSPQSLSKFRNELTSDEAYHLLRRTSFGASPAEVQAAVDRGLEATVDDLLTYREASADFQALAEEYNDDVVKRWLLYMIDGPNPLRERLALFWHDRFAASRRVLEYRDRRLAVVHWQMLRSNAFGNYANFLRNLTLDPLMLIWLDGANSPKDNPNENYAREFWELFTLGRDVLYTEEDVRESARAFTGITLYRESGEDARPIFDIINHDETLKIVLPDRADPANHNYESIIDLTLAQPEAARYVVRNLFECFVHDHPDDALLNDLAAGFVASGYEISPLVRRILISQAMFSSEARWNQVSSPVEQYVGVQRTLDGHFYSEDSLGYQLTNIKNDLTSAGQEVLDPPGVEGWSEDEAWLQDQWVLNRVRALNRWLDYGPNHDPQMPFNLLPAESTWDQREAAENIVRTMARVFHLNLTDDEVDVYIDVLDKNGFRAFHLQEQYDQRRNVREMIRLLAMHEEVIGR